MAVLFHPSRIKRVRLGVRIRKGQRVTAFQLGGKDILAQGYDPAVGAELDTVKRFEMEGENWVGWSILQADLPKPINNFTTKFGLKPGDPDGQTVMWAAVFSDEATGFAGDHVFVGYADVTMP